MKNISDAFVIAWSMGVQVSLALFQEEYSVIRGMVLLNGAIGGAVREVLGKPNWFFVEPLCRQISKSGNYWRKVGPYLARSRVFQKRFTQICIAMGWLSVDLDRQSFFNLLEQWLDLDLRIIAEQIVVLGNHSTSPFVDSIDIPILVVMGKRDPLVSNRLTRELANRLPNSLLFCFQKSSHFTLMEYPQTLHRLIKERLQKSKKGDGPVDAVEEALEG